MSTPTRLWSALWLSLVYFHFFSPAFLFIFSWFFLNFLFYLFILIRCNSLFIIITYYVLIIPIIIYTIWNSYSSCSSSTSPRLRSLCLNRSHFSLLIILFRMGYYSVYKSQNFFFAHGRAFHFLFKSQERSLVTLAHISTMNCFSKPVNLFHCAVAIFGLCKIWLCNSRGLRNSRSSYLAWNLFVQSSGK